MALIWEILSAEKADPQVQAPCWAKREVSEEISELNYCHQALPFERIRAIFGADLRKGQEAVVVAAAAAAARPFFQTQDSFLERQQAWQSAEQASVNLAAKTLETESEEMPLETAISEMLSAKATEAKQALEAEEVVCLSEMVVPWVKVEAAQLSEESVEVRPDPNFEVQAQVNQQRKRPKEILASFPAAPLVAPLQCHR